MILIGRYVDILSLLKNDTILHYKEKLYRLLKLLYKCHYFKNMFYTPSKLVYKYMAQSEGIVKIANTYCYSKHINAVKN